MNFVGIDQSFCLECPVGPIAARHPVDFKFLRCLELRPHIRFNCSFGFLDGL